MTVLEKKRVGNQYLEIPPFFETRYPPTHFVLRQDTILDLLGLLLIGSRTRPYPCIQTQHSNEKSKM